jgi:hypothetical protein
MVKNIVYLLVLNDNTAFKVGITNLSNFSRIEKLHKIYNFNLKESYYIEIKNSKLGSTLEKQLHNDYKDFQYQFQDKKDGSTEFLKIDCFEDVLADIKHKQRLTHLGIKINKTIEINNNYKSDCKLIDKIKTQSILNKILDAEEYLDNKELFKYFESNKEYLSYIDIGDENKIFSSGVIVVKGNYVENILDVLVHFHDKLNKQFNRKEWKMHNERYFRLFRMNVGYKKQKIGLVYLTNYLGDYSYSYAKYPLKKMKLDDIYFYLRNNLPLATTDTHELILENDSGISGFWDDVNKNKLMYKSEKENLTKVIYNGN